MISDNEKDFIKALEEYKISAHDATVYLKENYNVDCEIDESGKINLSVENPDNTLMLVAAKNYLYENLNNDFLMTNLDNLNTDFE